MQYISFKNALLIVQFSFELTTSIHHLRGEGDPHLVLFLYVSEYVFVPHFQIGTINIYLFKMD